jgi:predicted  nucleic acid-binding Zn-ribbon protein
MFSKKNKRLYKRIESLNKQLEEVMNENLLLKQSQNELEEYKESLKRTENKFNKVRLEYISLISEVKELKSLYTMMNKELKSRLNKNKVQQ